MFVRRVGSGSGSVGDDHRDHSRAGVKPTTAPTKDAKGARLKVTECTCFMCVCVCVCVCVFVCVYSLSCTYPRNPALSF